MILSPERLHDITLLPKMEITFPNGLGSYNSVNIKVDVEDAWLSILLSFRREEIEMRRLNL